MLTRSQTLNLAEGAPSWGDLMGDLPQGTRSAFEALAVKKFYPAGFTLFTEGQAPRGLFVLCRGLAQLSMSGYQTRQIILRTVREGEILGLSATVSGEPYETTAETILPCEFGFVARDAFLRFLRDNSEAAFRVVQVLSQDLDAILEWSRQHRSAAPPI